jgi:hypothetical protein
MTCSRRGDETQFNAAARRAAVPLPWGEGQGEGQTSTRSVPLFDAHWCRLVSIRGYPNATERSLEGRVIRVPLAIRTYSYDLPKSSNSTTLYQALTTILPKVVRSRCRFALFAAFAVQGLGVWYLGFP